MVDRLTGWKLEDISGFELIFINENTGERHVIVCESVIQGVNEFLGEIQK